MTLWWFRLGSAAEATPALELLDADERARFRQLRDPDAARFFAFRRAARRAILASCLGADPASLGFANSPGGKPHLAEPPCRIGFNASDSGTLGVVAINPDGPVGVDLELPRALDAARFGERILSPAERMICQTAPPGERMRLILRAWTVKEAVLKGTGTGLDLWALRQIAAPLAARPDAWQAVALSGRMADRGSWQVWTHMLAVGQPQPAVVSLAAPSALPVRVVDARPLLAQFGLG
ncbi:MAG TPA: 4'-phosphopantetheinyl transferase superfamily protein [Thermohalobaculum sp.]|nr:4'-phosphopantetheinyl transferase superfamily protein [Thermohalobaculum sp.]